MPSFDNAVEDFNARAQSRGWFCRVAPVGDFDRPELTAVHALWCDKSAGAPMPARAALSARVMKPWMPNMSLLERVAEGGRVRYRVRLHGSRLARYNGDKSGKFLDESISPIDAEAYAAVYDLIVATGRPLRLTIEYRVPQISFLTGESFVAPLSRPESDTPLILSVTYTRPRRQAARAAANIALR
ncbi:MAG TPA: PAS domain-containing protein [Rhizomicrobium sp.]